jgi:dTMP kinase
MLDVLRSIRKYYKKKDVDTLIIVRYLMGTAYLPTRFAKIAYSFFEKFVPTSNYMFFLDTDPNMLLSRVEARKEKEIFESLDELMKVRKKALMLARRWNIINTSGSVEVTFSFIERLLIKLDKKQ